MIRSALTHAAAVYLGAGLFCGLLIGQAIPALNPFGVAYITATWPMVIYCAPVERGCSAMPPSWMATSMYSFGGGE